MRADQAPRHAGGRLGARRGRARRRSATRCARSSPDSTTRCPTPRATPRAPGEMDGTDFHFVTEAAVHAPCATATSSRSGRQVHGHLYGTPAKAARGRAAPRASTCCSTSTPHGARPAPRALPGGGARSSSWRPRWPSSSARLRERKSDAAGEIARRLSRAREEIAAVAAVRLPDRQPRREGGGGPARDHHPGRALPHEPPDPQIPRPGGTRLMAFPSLEKSLDKVSNRYLLVVLAAKRARQLNRGAQPRRSRAATRSPPAAPSRRSPRPRSSTA